MLDSALLGTALSLDCLPCGLQRERECARERESAREMSRAERHAVRINVSFVFIYTIVRFCLRIFMCKTDKVREAVAESNRGMLKGRES